MELPYDVDEGVAAQGVSAPPPAHPLLARVG